MVTAWRTDILQMRNRCISPMYAIFGELQASSWNFKICTHTLSKRASLPFPHSSQLTVSLPTRDTVSHHAALPSAYRCPICFPGRSWSKGLRLQDPGRVSLAGDTRDRAPSLAWSRGQVYGVIHQLHADPRLTLQPSAACTAALSKSRAGAPRLCHRKGGLCHRKSRLCHRKSKHLRTQGLRGCEEREAPGGEGCS